MTAGRVTARTSTPSTGQRLRMALQLHVHCIRRGCIQCTAVEYPGNQSSCVNYALVPLWYANLKVFVGLHVFGGEPDGRVVYFYDSNLVDCNRRCDYIIRRQLFRAVLDFDFEKLCSISLSHLNVYACMVCGKYFQVWSRPTFFLS